MQKDYQRQKTGARFNLFIKLIGVSQKEFADKLNVAPPYIYKMKKGELSFEPYLEKLNEMGLNLNWLYTGKGDMLMEENFIKKVRIRELKEEITNSQKELQELIDSIGE